MFDDVLLGIAGQCDALVAVQAFEQDVDLERGEILYLVDRNVTVTQRAPSAQAQWANPQLPRAKQQRVVLGIQLRMALGVPLQPRKEFLVAPLVPFDESSDFLLRKSAGCVFGAYLDEQLLLGERTRPVVERLVGALRSADSPNLFGKCGLHGGMEFQALNESRGVRSGPTR